MDAALFGGFRGFVIEVVQYFNVIGQKSDRHDDQIANPLSTELLHMITNVRVDPRVLWTA